AARERSPQGQHAPVNYLLLHADTWSPGDLALMLEQARIEARGLRAARELSTHDRPTVFLLDGDSRPRFPVESLRAFVDAGGAIVALGRDGETDVPEGYSTELLSGFVPVGAGQRQLLVALRSGYREAAARAETARARSEAAMRSREIGELTRIGVMLGTERALKTLLDQVLEQARRITQSDAGSLHLVETSEQGTKRRRFRLAQN